jgi:aminoglycoside phosphotransferase
MSSEILRQSLPADLAQVINGYNWRKIHVGCSAAQVFRLEAENENSFYLKIAARSFENSLLTEKSKLDWLKNRLSVPEIIMFVQDDNSDYLLLSEISGIDASSDFYKQSEAEVIEQMAKGLKMIHSVPIADCPFDARLDYKIESAKQRMLNGLVDESEFDAERTGKCAEDLFRELIENKPCEENLVFTHGDYCLPNIILKNKRLNGFIDWGSAGVADKYQDIALLARSVASNFDAEWTQNLFKALDIEPDLQKIKFYTLLDEFF